ncbi:MAG: peptidylprolyl isomerase [Blastocatellia bacterium]
MKTRIAFILSLALLALALGACKKPYKEITSQELTMLVDTFPEMQKRNLAENEKGRQELLKQVKQLFAIAQAGEAAGVEKTEKFKVRTDIQVEELLANTEAKKSGETSGKPSEVSEAETTAYIAAHGKEFDSFFKMLTEGSKEQPPPEQMEIAKKGWAELKIRADRARKAGYDKTPDVQLQIKIQRAQFLAQAYQETMNDSLKPTPQELADYYKSHPNADPEKIKEQAEDVLKKVKAGGDFAALAGQYSADGSGANGGLLRWFGKGRMVPEFEAAAFSMQKGQVSDLVKSKYGYHIIRVDDRAKRKPNKTTDDANNEDEQELVLARHILISTNEVENAENEIRQKKAQRLMDDLTLKYPVTAPADFLVNVKGIRSAETPSLKLPGAAASPAPEKK